MSTVISLASATRSLWKVTLSTFAVLGLALSLVVTGPPAKAQAADARNFDPGLIITDSLFYNGTSMSAGEIQDFLNQRLKTCLIGTPPYLPGAPSPSGSGNTIASNCLKDFRQTTSSRPADAYCSGYAGQPNESAAQIIEKVGRACGISQKVLLVMLEKEQSLLTDSWPVTRQYNYALGMNCPDSGPNNSANCDSASAGFSLQLYLGARQLKVYKGNPSSFNYKPFQNNTIQWHPNAGCGTSQVYIQNWATAALYIYTPYRPNQAALNAGWGTGDACSSYGNRNFYLYYASWFGAPVPPANVDPLGNIDSVVAVPGGIKIRGWAIDPDTPNAIDIHVYSGGIGHARTADAYRPDVGQVYPGFGDGHGFDTFVPFSASGRQEVCIYGINQGPGSNSLIGCRGFDAVPGGPPSGEITTASGQDGVLTVSGWAVDPDSMDTVNVRVTLAGTSETIAAGQGAPTPPAHFSHLGANHGFTFSTPKSAGTYNVCLVAVNIGVGSDTPIGCRDIKVTSKPIEDKGLLPFGSLDSINVSAGKVNVSGWAIDPDTTDSITVKTTIDSQEHSFLASNERRDLLPYYPKYGAAHGFSFDVTDVSGNRRVCVKAVDTGGRGETELGCKNVTIPPATTQPPPTVTDKGRMPFGSLDSVNVSPGKVNVSGWAIDPDTAAPVDVHAYVGAKGFSFPAELQRSDLAQVYPDYGGNHGFSYDVFGLSGPQTVCLYAIDNGNTGNTLLGCKNVLIP